MGVFHAVGAANYIWPMTSQASISRSEKCGALSGSTTAAGRACGICGFVAVSDRQGFVVYKVSVMEITPGPCRWAGTS